MDNEIIILDEKSIRDKIYIIRNQKVMLDSDLAEIYGYSTKAFNQQVQRNIDKFDDDFMFQLTEIELNDLRSQIVTAKVSKMSRTLPYVFTEAGVYMLMTVLKGELAVKQSKALIRIFQSMKDYIVNTNQIPSYEDYMILSLQTTDNVKQLEEHYRLIDKHDNELKLIRKEMKDIHKLLNSSVLNETIILNGKLSDGILAYNKIFSQAKKTIYIIDDYISLKTLVLLKDINPKVKVIIFSDNVNKTLHSVEYLEFINEYNIDIILKRTENKTHDRYIILDYNYKDVRIYHWRCFT